MQPLWPSSCEKLASKSLQLSSRWLPTVAMAAAQAGHVMAAVAAGDTGVVEVADMAAVVAMEVAEVVAAMEVIPITLPCSDLLMIPH